MAKPITNDLRVTPRPFALIAELLTFRDGKRVSPQAVEECHRNAIKKLRKALAKEGITFDDLRRAAQ
jgi:hypothetical protein